MSGASDRVQAGLTRREHGLQVGADRCELQELAAVVELAASAVRTAADSADGDDDQGCGQGGNFAVLLDALGLTMGELSAAERGTLVYLAADEQATVRRLAGLIRRSR